MKIEGNRKLIMALCGLFSFTGLLAWQPQIEPTSLALSVTMIVTVFAGSNVAEHISKRKQT